MIGNIPFSIPTEFASGIADGSLMRIGSLLKDSATGKIVAHVQETGIAQQLFSGITSSPFSPLNALSFASSGYANVQLSQLKTMMEGLQVLQYVNLGVSIAGIGVSVIGFAIMDKKLKSIEEHIVNLNQKLDQHFQDWLERDLRKHCSQIYILFEKADIAHTLTNSSDKWLSVESQLADKSGFFREEIAHLLGQDKFNVDLFIPLVRSLALCNAARIECLLLANELPAAHKVASIIGQNYSALFDDIIPFQLASKSFPEDEHSQSILRQNQLEINPVVQGIRDVTDAALTKPFLIETLIEKGIAGRDFISVLRDEKEHPLLLLGV
jgi:hypothetical protein